MCGTCCLDSVRRRAIVLRMFESLTTSCGISPGSTGRGGRRWSRRRRCLRSAAASAEIGADDSPAGAAAREAGKVDALRFGEAARERAGLDPVARIRLAGHGRRRLGRRFAAAGRRRRGLGHFRLLLRRFGLGCWRRLGRVGLGRGRGRNVLALRPAMVAMTAPTFTPSVPSGTRIFAIVPSSTASNSIVALSVSISARRSPEATLSPSLTSHLASVPSSIVGDSAGILSSIGIGTGPF